jgi:hypothetical protein
MRLELENEKVFNIYFIHIISLINKKLIIKLILTKKAFLLAKHKLLNGNYYFKLFNYCTADSRKNKISIFMLDCIRSTFD